MGTFLFNFIVIVDWDIHENDAAKAKRSTLLGLSKDVCPHYFSRAENDFKITVINFGTYEEVSAFDVFSAVGTG